MPILPTRRLLCGGLPVTKAAALDQLSAMLQGKAVSGPDWTAIIALANEGLITPRLEHHLDATAPDDVRTFVDEVARRNGDRNTRLFGQMADAAAALNAADIVPLVLKGGACLARTGGRCDRVINDIDLVVAPGRIEVALHALKAAGFSVIHQRAGAALHAIAELARPDDVGFIDLHQRPPGPPAFVSGPDILNGGKTWRVGSAQVRAPDPHMHIYLQALHDQLHDGGYWRGGFDLRHAWDIAELIRGEEAVDWEALQRLSPTRLTAHAVEAQLIVCHLLTGAPIPKAMRGWRARLHFERQRLQYIAPALTPSLVGLAMLFEAGNLLQHRNADRQGRSNAGLPPSDDGVGAGLTRLRRLLATDMAGRL